MSKSTEERLSELENLANSWKWRLGGIAVAIVVLIGVSLLDAPGRAISAFSSSQKALQYANESARLAELTAEHHTVAKDHRKALENEQSIVWGRWEFDWRENHKPASPLENVTVQGYKFPSGAFKSPPVVFVAIEYYDTDPSQVNDPHVRMLAVPSNVDTEGFDLQLTYEGTGKVFHFEGKWLAIPSSVTTQAACEGVACYKSI